MRHLILGAAALGALLATGCSLPTTCDTDADCIPPANFCNEDGRCEERDYKGSSSSGGNGPSGGSSSSSSGSSGVSSSSSSSTSSGGIFQVTANIPEMLAVHEGGGTTFRIGNINVGANTVTVALTASPQDALASWQVAEQNLAYIDVEIAAAPMYGQDFQLSLTLSSSIPGVQSFQGFIPVVVTPVNDPPTTGAVLSPVAVQAGEFGTVAVLTGISPGPMETSDIVSLQGISSVPMDYFTRLEGVFNEDRTTLSLEYKVSPDAQGAATVTIVLQDLAGLTTSADVTFNAPSLRPTVDTELAGGSVSGCVPIEYHLAQPQERPVDVTVEYSVDGVTYHPATPASGSPGRHAQASGTGLGISHQFLWDTDADAAQLRQRPVGQPVNVRVTGTVGPASHADSVDVLVRPTGTLVEATVQQTNPNILEPQDMAAGDLNLDGLTDAVTVSIDGKVWLFTNATEYFGAPPAMQQSASPLATLPGARRTVVADVNSDGLLDIVVAHDLGFSVLVNTSTGPANAPAFSAPQTIATMADHSVLAAADVDADGTVDIITEDDTGDLVLVHPNSTPPFGSSVSVGTALPVPLGGPVKAAGAADLDADGLLELVVVRAGEIRTVKLGPSGTVVDTETLFQDANWSPLRLLALEDISGDGRPDVVAASAGTLVVGSFPNPDESLFQLTPVAANDLRWFSVLDVNDDGLNDVVWTEYVPQLLQTVLNARGITSSAWATPHSTPMNGRATTGALGDFNRDGRRDVLLGVATGALIPLVGEEPSGRCDPGLRADPAVAASPSEPTVAVAEVDGDGNPDLVVADAAGVRVHVGAGTGEFDAAVTVSTVQTVRQVVPGRFRGGAMDDVALVWNDGVTVLRRDGSGTGPLGLMAVDLTSGAFVDALAADLDDDGFDDLVLAGDSGVIVVRGAPEGLSSAGMSVVTSARYLDVVAAPNPAGGPPDLMLVDVNVYTLVRATNTSVPGTIELAFNVETDPGATPVHALQAGDLDADGDVDLAYGRPSGSPPSSMEGLVVRWGDGTGFTMEPQRFSPALAKQVEDILMAQLGGGPALDLVVLEANNDVIQVRVDAPGAADLISFSGRYSVGSGARSLHAADVDTDGDLDLLVASEDGSVRLMRNTGTGDATTLFEQRFRVTGGATRPRQLSVQDLDFDGRPDMVALEGLSTFSARLNTAADGGIALPESSASSISGDVSAMLVANVLGGPAREILLGSATYGRVEIGTGLLSPPVAFQVVETPGSPGVMAADDLDGDGHNDLLVATTDGGTLAAYRHAVDAGVELFVEESPQSLGAPGSHLLLLDLNQDGRLDVVTATSESAGLRIFPNTSAGGTISLGAVADQATAGMVSALAAGDLDGDGRKEILVGHPGGAATVLFIGDGGAMTPQAVDSIRGPAAMVMVDLDNNGLDDVVVLEQHTNAVAVHFSKRLVGVPPPAFITRRYHSGLKENVSLAVADMDLDGKQDVIVGGVDDSMINSNGFHHVVLFGE